MIKWDKDNPLHREIMDAAANAWRATELRHLEAEMDRILALLPWWMRLYIRVAVWFIR